MSPLSSSRSSRHSSSSQSSSSTPHGPRSRSRSRSRSPSRRSRDHPPSASSSQIPDDSAASSSSSEQDTTRKRPGDELTKTGRSKRQQSDPLLNVGRLLARVYSPFTIPSVILDEGITRILNSSEDADPSEFTEVQNRNHAAFAGAISSNQKLLEEILNASTERYVKIWKLLKTGQGKARTEDTRLLKLSIVDWIVWGNHAAPKRTAKAERGFNHPVILKLLAPVDLELTSENMDALRAGNAQIEEEDGSLRAINGSDWIHAWYDGEYDSSNLLKGFLKNQLLVKAYRAIFTSPSSADREPGTSSATRSGNAAIYNMTGVTPSSIAYVCTQVYFSLTSHETFSRTSNILDLDGIYDSLMSFFESSSPQVKAYVKELLGWWNRTIFPASMTRRGGGRGTIARLESQLAAQALAPAP